MILCDLSQIISATIYMGDAHECAKHPSEASKNMIKHSVFNSIRANYVMHKRQYGNMVLACDSGSWRYDVFPQYKHKRKLKRQNDDSGINWDFVNAVKSDLISDLDNFFPFPVIKLDRVEGDDIIGVLCKYITESVASSEENLFGNDDPEDILIISSDRDNLQTHALGKHVKQWSPMDKKLIRAAGPIRHALIEKIVKGDAGDGVVNIKSGDNAFVDGIRQKPISAKFLQTFFDAKSPIDACTSEEERKNFIRNEQLVSYEKIPADIQNSIITCYNNQCSKKHSKMGLMNYLSQNSMANILSNITDFYK